MAPMVIADIPGPTSTNSAPRRKSTFFPAIAYPATTKSPRIVVMGDRINLIIQLNTQAAVLLLWSRSGVSATPSNDVTVQTTSATFAAASPAAAPAPSQKPSP